MPRQFIDQLQEGMAVKDFFLVRQVESRTAKTGKPYLHLVLGDKSGTLVARVWDDILKKCPAPFVVGDFVGLKGQVESYKQELQINVKYIETIESIRSRGGDLSAFDPELLILTTPYDRQQLWQELQLLAATHIQPPLQELVLRLLERYQEQLMAYPAARKNHHPYLGGLLEHTWFVARHAQASLAIYPEINPSLALAGAILHDLGKVKEIAGPTIPELTVPGQLLGHIVLGWEMLREEARAIDFPDAALLIQLEHIILAHHGELEFGSPILPKTREALLVHYLDKLDADLKMMSQHLQDDAGNGDFTSRHWTLKREFFKGGEQQDRSAPKEEKSEK